MFDDYKEIQRPKNKERYQARNEIHALPQIFHYWSEKFIRPKMQEVFDISTVRDFYAHGFARTLNHSQSKPRFVSIGSGNCSTEIEICEALIARGYNNFEFICLEVNDRLLQEAKLKISERGLHEIMRPRYFDLDRDSFDLPAQGFMAHHCLHRIVELERLFSVIDSCLMPHGRFLTIDMIGRNGHMRWPETLQFVEAIWTFIDRQKKYNHQRRETYEQYLNFDCSEQGFEGIRAQDIMPLVLSRFSFEAFFGIGGITEIFVDRSYGPNFDIANPRDLVFIDFVEHLNAGLIELGAIKPTMLFAHMTKKDAAQRLRLYKNQTPEFCLRVPGESRPPYVENKL